MNAPRKPRLTWTRHEDDADRMTARLGEVELEVEYMGGEPTDNEGWGWLVDAGGGDECDDTIVVDDVVRSLDGLWAESAGHRHHLLEAQLAAEAWAFSRPPRFYRVNPWRWTQRCTEYVAWLLRHGRRLDVQHAEVALARLSLAADRLPLDEDQASTWVDAVQGALALLRYVARSDVVFSALAMARAEGSAPLDTAVRP